MVAPSQDELADDIIGIPEYKPQAPIKKDFLPWHRPRKQFVRQEQWTLQIGNMIKDIVPENKVLKYLGLPGEDLLDLRYFHEHICVPNNLHLRFLGFNNGASSLNKSSELNISLDEVSKLPFVDPSSNIIPDDICQIANTNSIAWNRSLDMGPYDVVNIDLCDGFGKHPHNQFKETHYNTLSQLLTLQARRTNPWLLLLTTRTGASHIDEEVYSRLKSLYAKNLLDCQAFQTFSTANFSIGNANDIGEVEKTPKGLSDIFLVSLCKWIGSLCVGQNPPAKVEVKSVLGYNIEFAAGHQDLTSLAIKISPTFLAKGDTIGLTSHSKKAPDECSIALQALRRVSKSLDIDSILANDVNLLNSLIETSSALLEEARYDTAAYSDWAKQAL